MTAPASKSAVPVVTIDGPSGSGKGTISREIARRLGWHYLDSGALYRALAYAASQRGIGLADQAGLSALARTLRLEFVDNGGDGSVQLDGAEVTDAIRTESAGEAASQVAHLAAVREALLDRQRDFWRPPGLVAEGRDMGTVVFPAADLKVFLTATPLERARRRHKQLKDKGISVSLPALAKEIEERDSRDANRRVSPLRPAADARTLDSTDVPANAVVARIMDWVRAAGLSPVVE